MWLFLAFLAIPIIEIALFIQVGGLIGLFPTLAIVVITAILGTWLVRSQGSQALRNLQSSFSELRDPTEPLAHGAMILIAGALLLTPGFFTDAVGFALLAPPVRIAVLRWARKNIKVTQFSMGQSTSYSHSSHKQRDPRTNAGRGQGEIIEGDYEEISKTPKPTHPGSGWTKH